MLPLPAASGMKVGASPSENGPRVRSCGRITILPVASKNAVHVPFAAKINPSCTCKGGENSTGTIT
jgi:hypothetical protein